ncbi:hypothetical protein [Sphingomonas xinjiangensis]|uniref:Uncharacterized protein n=1 Tax=Sphingomonas xinjiangensis TaxID=643568 RepID=A0A840YPF3_9SPHN|nr:hypothetical protein [Sphingomonas xinjiangensis]MBB5712170.1 hypothetical protein [Sphingomonas xinjiangensis]
MMDTTSIDARKQVGTAQSRADHRLEYASGLTRVAGNGKAVMPLTAKFYFWSPEGGQKMVRVEIITRTGRRRIYNDDEKARQPGLQSTVVAL